MRSGFLKRPPRIDVRRPAQLIDSDGRVFEITILDISSAGFRIEVTESPRIDEPVTLRLDHDEEFAARIRWTLGREAGGIFLPLPGDSEESDTGREEE